MFLHGHKLANGDYVETITIRGVDFNVYTERPIRTTFDLDVPTLDALFDNHFLAKPCQKTVKAIREAGFLSASWWEGTAWREIAPVENIT